ncbi:MAG: TetR-like C-terminal domain-containing protein [Anaerolineae bacterium]
MFEHVTQHARFYQVMMGAEGVPAFIAGVRDYIAESPCSGWRLCSRHPKSAVPLEIVANSLKRSMLGVLIWWLEHDIPHSPDYMAEQFRLLISSDLRQVLSLRPLTGDR